MDENQFIGHRILGGPELEQELVFWRDVLIKPLAWQMRFFIQYGVGKIELLLELGNLGTSEAVVPFQQVQSSVWQSSFPWGIMVWRDRLSGPQPSRAAFQA